jgi:hypothetical protein
MLLGCAKVAQCFDLFEVSEIAGDFRSLLVLLTLTRIDLKRHVVDLTVVLMLCSPGRDTLRSDPYRLGSLLDSDDFDIESTIHLPKAVLNSEADESGLNTLHSI